MGRLVGAGVSADQSSTSASWKKLVVIKVLVILTLVLFCNSKLVEQGCERRPVWY